MMKRTPLALILLLSLGLIWGTGYSIARLAMTNGVHPLSYSFWQSLGPALLLSLLTLMRRHSSAKDTVQIPRLHPSIYYFISGLTGIVIPNTAMYFAAPHLPAGVLAMIVNIVPIIAYPIALLVRLEHFNWLRMLGVLLACCGLMLIILPQYSLPSPAMIPWALVTLTTPISFAICSIFVARYQPEHADPYKLSQGMLFASSLMLIPFVSVTHHFYLFHIPLSFTDKIILLEILLSSIGYVLFFQLIKIAGPVYYSLVDSIVVLTGLFWGYMIFHEQLNEWTATAVILILFALGLVTSQQHRQINQKTELLANPESKNA